MFRRLLGLIVVVLALGFGTNLPAHAQNTQDFSIKSFTAEYYLNRTPKNVSTMKADETIVAVFPDIDQNHGILRALPQSYKGLPLNVDIRSVTNDLGRPYHFTTSKSRGNLVLKIGDPNNYVHGLKTYHIVYTMKDVVSFYDDHDELYWNVNGDQWQQPFGEVTARVHIPKAIADGLQDQQVCYTGVRGSTASDCTIARANRADETEVTTTARGLSYGENLSFVLSFDKGTFNVDKDAIRAQELKKLAIVTGAILPPLLTLGFMVSRWRKYGRDPKGRGVIVPQYIPPKNLNVLTSDVILNEKVRDTAVTAQLIELAVKGYVAIHETSKKVLIKKSTNYALELVKPYDDKLTPEEKDVLDLFFGDNHKLNNLVNISEIKFRLDGKFELLTKTIPVRVLEAGYFSNNPATIIKKYGIFGVALTLIGVGGIILFTVLTMMILVAWLAGLLISGVIITFVAKKMPARTNKGVEIHDYLLGLKDYIKLAETDRIKFLQSPEGVKQYGDPKTPKAKIKLFEKLLPYAMIFGLEKDWAKQFQDIYREAPDWYQGNWSTFNTINLSNSINSFTTASNVAFNPQSSSGSSGFGGGGFSGGGGGGGGGGGW